MKALCWNGKRDVQVENVPDPAIINPGDAIIRVTSTAICGSDLHLYNAKVAGMREGDILGHEFMGEVVETGPAVTNLKRGDRVVVPFTICCGKCRYCKRELWSLCDNTNPNARIQAALYGFATAGLFGYSHLYGGYAGGQAEYVRVPFADVGPFIVPDHLTDEQVLFLSDIGPTAMMAAENCNINKGDIVAVWGCGPVGLLSIVFAYHFGASRVIAIDKFGERLHMAAKHAKAETIDFDTTDVVEQLKQMTGGRGPDACIDAVGMEAFGHSLDAVYDRARNAVRLATDRIHALRQAIQACGKGGHVSIPGVYGGLLDKLNFGAAFAKGLTLKMGQTHVRRYMNPLVDLIEAGKIDLSFVITHRLPLEDADDAYEIFNDKEDHCVKVVLKP